MILHPRKLIPALYSLKNQNLMPEKFALIGVGRSELTTEEFRNKMEEAIMTYSEEKDLAHEHDFRIYRIFSLSVRWIILSPQDYEKLKSLIIRNL